MKVSTKSSGRKILLTGAAGFIGSHLLEALVAGGHQVTALLHYNATQHVGNLSDVDRAVLSQVRLEFGDVCDPEQMVDLAQGQEIIIHAAALIGIPYSYAAPRSYLRTNAEATMNMLEAARRHGVARLVLVSTSEVYGSAIETPIHESHPLQAQSPYSASKIAAEVLVEAWRRNFAVPAVIIRPFNTYGPRQSRRAIIPTIIAQALIGETLRLGALAPVRDFSFVTSTASGIMTAALHPDIGPGPYNLCTGMGISIEDLVTVVGRLIGRRLTVAHDQRRLRPPEGEVDRLIGDNSAFRNMSGWNPETSLEEGLRRTISAMAEKRLGDGASNYVV
jgi:nucleoside-diphosphate-sugar epimerase